PSGVLTRTGLVNPVRTNGKRAVHTVSTARPISTAKHVSTARLFAPKIAQTGSAILNNVRSRASYSPIKRSYYTKLVVRPKDLKQDVKTSGVKNMTSARTRAVVNTGKGKMDNALKKSRWVWRPKGNYMDHESKEKGSFILKKFEYGNPEICLQDHAVVDSGCSSHMTDNKAYLSYYEDYNGGFVAFGISAASLVNTVKPTLSTARLEGNSDFHEIVDFLASSSIHHALTLSPPIYTSYIEQFWNIASSQTVNDVKQIDATVDSKAVVVTEASIRSSLLFNDADGTACLTNEAIFQNHALMGYEGDCNKLTFQKALFSPQWKFLIHSILHCLSSKSTSWNEFSINIASAVICLATDQKFNFFEIIFDGMLRNLDNTKKKFVMYPRFLMVFLNNQIELGEPFNDVYPTPAHNLKVFTTMSRKGLKFLGKITPLFPKNNTFVSQQVSTARPARPDIDAARQKDSMKEEKAKEKGVSTKDVDDSSRPTRSILTLKPLPTIDPKDKGEGVLKESPVKKVKISDLDAAQIAKDAEIARLVHEKELAEMEREREERQRQDQASVDYIASLYDEVQAKMDASEELAARLQMEEREMYTIEERSKLLAEFFERRKKLLAEERVAAVRNKPPTRTQLRSLMMTYLKHTGKYRHNQLNKKTFEEIQALYIKEQERDADFVPIGSERDEKMIDKMNKKAAGMDEEEVPEEPESTKVEVKQEGREENIRKRSGRRLKMKATKKSKRQKTDSDLEEEEQLRASLKIVPDEEEEIDYEVLGTRYPIVNWESAFYHTDRYGVPHDYYRVFRANGSSRYIKTFTEMVSRFDRLDFIELHSLVMQRFSTTTPEGIDLVLWGDLRIMFEETADDDIWKNQEKWIIKSWTFYENCGVHILALEDGTEIHMLAERRYPLIRETLERMMELRLTAESEGEAVFDLLRFIQKQIDEFGGQDGSEKDL
ncbi:hypothetical protein Tco_0788082, partial [Tanacetum coccineum]